MPSINHVTIAGNLGGTPEVKFTQSGQAVTTLSIAVNEKWKDAAGADKEHTEWVRAVVWGKQAEACGKYLQKGAAVLIEGKLRTREWEKDGVKKYTTEVQTHRVHFLGSKSDGGSGSTRREEPSSPTMDDDIPF